MLGFAFGFSRRLSVQSLKRDPQPTSLLEIAKTAVERAIETDEATATTWINEKLDAWGIHLFNVNE